MKKLMLSLSILAATAVSAANMPSGLRDRRSAAVFVEYDHYDFGTRTIGLTSTLRGDVQNFDIRERKDVVKAGLNWRFNFLQPVVARY